MRANDERLPDLHLAVTLLASVLMGKPGRAKAFGKMSDTAMDAAKNFASHLTIIADELLDVTDADSALGELQRVLETFTHQHPGRRAYHGAEPRIDNEPNEPLAIEQLARVVHATRHATMNEARAYAQHVVPIVTELFFLCPVDQPAASLLRALLDAVSVQFSVCHGYQVYDGLEELSDRIINDLQRIAERCSRIPVYTQMSSTPRTR
jgi:hypothetical protein